MERETRVNLKLPEVFLRRDDSYPSNFGCDAKNVGSALDDIFAVMDDKDIEIIPELHELKQYLRFKGNSRREQGDYLYWKVGKG